MRKWASLLSFSWGGKGAEKASSFSFPEGGSSTGFTFSQGRSLKGKAERSRWQEHIQTEKTKGSVAMPQSFILREKGGHKPGFYSERDLARKNRGKLTRSLRGLLKKKNK